MFAEFINNLYSKIEKLPFDALVWIVWGSLAAIYLVIFVLCIISRRARSLSKRPFLCLINAYSGVNLALYLFKCELAQAILCTALFWVVGYLLYGSLCLFSSGTEKKRTEKPSAGNIVPEYRPIPPKPVAVPQNKDIPAAKNNVRLDHAVAVTDNLLLKNLGKSDRQELEKLKNTLAVLQIKGTLSPVESDILNDNFNMLLKMMAKYNV